MPVRAAVAALILVVVFIFSIGANESLVMGIISPAEASIAQHPAVIFIRYPAYEENDIHPFSDVGIQERYTGWRGPIERRDTPVDLYRTQSLIWLQFFGPWRNAGAVPLYRIDRVELDFLRVVWSTISHGYHDYEITGDLDSRHMKSGPMCGEVILLIERGLLVDQDSLPISNAYLSGHDGGLVSVNAVDEHSNDHRNCRGKSDNNVGNSDSEHGFVPPGIIVLFVIPWGIIGAILGCVGRRRWVFACGIAMVGTGPILVLFGWMFITAWNEGLI